MPTTAPSNIQPFNGDGNAATSATLDYVSGISIDNTGKMYLTEYTGHRIRVIAPSCPTITISPVNSVLRGATLGTSYSETITQTGYLNGIIWSVRSGTLPSGLSLNPTTGVISGTPTSTGTYNFTIQARDCTCVKTKTYSIVVCPQVSICLKTSCPLCRPVNTNSCAPSLLMPEVGVPYNDFTNPNALVQYFTQTGLTGSVTWSISPTLPAGLTLNPSTGVITGTLITALGKRVLYTITASDGSCSASGIYFFDSMLIPKINSSSKALDTENRLLSNQITVSPNPTTGIFKINFGTLNVSKSLINIYSSQGTSVYKGYVSNNMSISLENVSSGIYFIEVDIQQGRVLKTLVKE